LGAQISRRILALKIAFITGRRSVFVDEVMHPYVDCYAPISSLPQTSYLTDGEPKFDFDAPNSHRIARFDFWDFWSNVDLRNKVLGYAPMELAEYGETGKLIFDGILSSSMRLREEFANYIESEYTRLGLNDFVAVHFRRGDKSVETPYVPAKKYKESILSQVKRCGATQIFIASDSNNAVRDLDLESSGLQVIFDTEEIRYNNANHRFLRTNPQLAAQETKTSIKNIYLLARGRRVVGQDNAHFATIAAGMIAARQPPKYGELIAGDLLMKSPTVRFYYSIKQGIRRVGKKLLPRKVISNLK
jgi:hypothetical protein